MITSILHRLKGAAWGLMVQRGATVAVHFVLMLWLARWLGLAGFGELAHLWAVALVASTFLAAGGPLVILRATAAQVMARFARVGMLHPLLLAAPAGAMLVWTGGHDRWASTLAMALALALSQNAASVLRVWGSLSVSMLLRDGLPVLVLGAAAVWRGTPEEIVLRAAIVLTVISLALLGLGATLVRPPHEAQKADAHQGQLWLSSVLGMAQAQADLVVAGVFLPAEVFGLYALLRRMANLVALPVSVATWVCAGPVAQAFATDDRGALARATARASAIAWYPALGLLGLAAVGAMAGLLARSPLFPPSALPLCAVLLGGALLQAYWAASYPVATLGPAPVMAVEARGLAVLLYGIAALGGGAALGPLGHALTYTLAMTAGSLHLWARLQRTYAVDTSARVLWHDRAAVA